MTNKQYENKILEWCEVEMVGRLEWLTFTPKTILHFSNAHNALQNKFEKAQITNLKIDYANDFDDSYYTEIAPHSIDFIFANLILPWSKNIKTMLEGWKRLLTANGLLMFSALGVDTLKTFSPHLIRPTLIDMHDLGDMLVNLQFNHPVMDVETICLNYSDNEFMKKELFSNGMLTTPECEENKEALHEIIFAHAWAPQQFISEKSQANEIHIPLSSIKYKKD